MLKKLQITSIAITIAAIGLIIFSIAGSASSAKTDKLLSSPGVAEQLQATYAGKRTSETDRDTPLMRQAKAFALRIDPPPPPPPPQPVQPANEPIRPKVDVSAQFTLIGTSYYEGNDANSWALLNEVGKGLHWVRPGETIGHLKIEKIGSGNVLIRDGQRTYEMLVEKVQKTDFVQAYTGNIPAIVTPDVWKGVEKPALITPPAAQIPEPQQTPEPNKADIQANIEWLKQLKDNPESLGMTAEEAKELEGLGDMLKTLETEQQQVNSEPNNAEKNEPNENVSPAIVDTNISQQPPAVQRPVDVNNNELRSKRAEILRSRRRR
jgi:hypothetical protein